MGTTELVWSSAHDLTEAYRRGETTPSAVAEAHLGRITELDSVLRAYLTVTADRARAAAAAADARWRADAPLGPPPP